MGWRLFEFDGTERHPSTSAFWNKPCAEPVRRSDHRKLLLDLPYMVVLQFQTSDRMLQLYVNEDLIPQEVL